MFKNIKTMKHGNMKQKNMLFFINYIVHDTVLAFSESSLFGFISATACSTTINFLGQKYYVFKQ